MKPRYKLRTLLILLAILPPLLWIGWTKYEAWRAALERREQEQLIARQRESEQLALRLARLAALRRQVAIENLMAVQRAQASPHAAVPQQPPGE
jgi:hypothetical protein